VAVQDPAKHANFPDKVLMNHGAIATSGSYEIFFDQERRFHHLVDAETGESPQWSVSVSVMAPTTLAADALATSLFMLAPQEGVQLIDSLSECECLIIDHTGRQLRSRGWTSADTTSS
jgi:thiamine biosynthesis lipoprotein